MNTREIEHMWKVASNNPNHDTNWHDPVVVSFANLVAKHTLSSIDPSKFMSYHEGIEAGRLAEREACAKVCDDINAKYKSADDVAERVASQWCADAIRARGETK
jgi:hypothetical protein